MKNKSAILPPYNIALCVCISNIILNSQIFTISAVFVHLDSKWLVLLLSMTVPMLQTHTLYERSNRNMIENQQISIK